MSIGSRSSGRITLTPMLQYKFLESLIAKLEEGARDDDRAPEERRELHGYVEAMRGLVRVSREKDALLAAIRPEELAKAEMELARKTSAGEA